MKKDTSVYLALSTNEEYALYTAVTIQSIITHNNSSRKYYIYILYTSLSKKNQLLLCSMRVDNVKIECINIVPYLKGILLPKYKHITEETHYRLLIPNIFQNLSKIIYLDSDLVCQTDISKLYDIDIGDYWLAGARDALMSKKLKKEFLLNDNYYLNMGVMLINCDAFRKNNLWMKYIELIKQKSTNMTYINNEALNILCHNNVLVINPRWNTLYHLTIGCCSDSIAGRDYQNYIKKFCVSFDQSSILHYSAIDKPWHYPQKKYMNIWWKYAKNIPFLLKF